MSYSKCVFTVDILLKQSRKGKHLAPLEFLAFPQNEKLCIVPGREHERSRQEKEARVGWVKRQIQIGVVV